MYNRKLSMYEVSTVLTIIRIVLSCIMAFYIFSHLVEETILRKDWNMSQSSYNVSKGEFNLPTIAATPPNAAEIQTIVDDRTPEERNEDRVFRLAQKVQELYPDVELSLILAVAKKESRYNPDAIGGGAYGLMQIIPFCHADRIERLGVTDILDPYSNLLVGTDLLSALLKQYKDTGLALMCYNMGEGIALYRYNNHGYSAYAEEVLRIKEEIERSERYGTCHQDKTASSEPRDS